MLLVSSSLVSFALMYVRSTAIPVRLYHTLISALSSYRYISPAFLAKPKIPGSHAMKLKSYNYYKPHSEKLVSCLPFNRTREHNTTYALTYIPQRETANIAHSQSKESTFNDLI